MCQISNAAGNFEPAPGPHSRYAPGATFGKPKGALKPETHNFTKKGTGKMGSVYLPSGIQEIFLSQFKVNGSTSRHEHQCGYKKPPIPAKDEKPIMGLVTKKNFVIANAVENMLARKCVAFNSQFLEPKVREEPMNWTKKPEYGKTPKYLQEIKQEIQREYDHIKAIHEQEEKEKDQEK